MTSSFVVNNLKSIFSRHGIPRNVVTTNDSVFIGLPFKEFGKEWEFNHIVTSRHFYQSNEW